ncbi:MAG: rhomboid family intramembrane serine protease [Chitinophagales bacterium]
MKITYNSPVILTFALLCTAIMIINNSYIDGIMYALFSVVPDMNYANPVSYFRLASHVIGHGGWEHLVGNLTFILLLGPMLEEKFGSFNLFLMMLITAVVTGLLNITFFNTGLLGASGIVFMFILLSSLTNFRSSQIPLTFLLVISLFLGKEIMMALANDNISQFAHIIGGICGGIFGYLFAKPKMQEQNYAAADEYIRIS